MGFWKGLGIFNMFTANSATEFLAGAVVYAGEEAKEEILANNNDVADEMIDTIQDLSISEFNKKEAIKCANKLRTSYKDKDVDYLVSKINKLTGCDFQ
ncbi:MAG: hypothetical protein RR334_03645 [Clostridia bacterium]